MPDNGWSGGFNTFLQIGGTLLVLVLVLVLAWLLLRWLNKRMPNLGAGAGNGRMIRVLDRVQVGKTSQLLLVRVKDKVLLVAVGDNASAKLCEFDDPDGQFTPPEPADSPGFSAALRDAAKRFGKPGPKDGDGGELP